MFILQYQKISALQADARPYNFMVESCSLCQDLFSNFDDGQYLIPFLTYKTPAILHSLLVRYSSLALQICTTSQSTAEYSAVLHQESTHKVSGLCRHQRDSTVITISGVFLCLSHTQPRTPLPSVCIRAFKGLCAPALTSLQSTFKFDNFTCPRTPMMHGLKRT